MIVRYEGFTGLEVYHMAKDGKNSLIQNNEFGIPMRNKFKIVVKPGLVMRKD